MITIKQHQLKILLNDYLQNNHRSQKLLNDIIELIQIQTNLLESMIEFPCSSIIALKYLIIIHKCLCQYPSNIGRMQNLLNMINTQNSNDFDRMLTIKLIKPYKLYLQKRINSRIIKLQQKQQTYFLINTLWRALSFADVVYTFGRYYIYNYPFFIDFNIILGIDLAIIYDKLIRGMSKQFKINLLSEIQKIHQKMYIVYYNCYFYKYLKPYVPRWISTQQGTPLSQKSIKSNQTSSSNNIKISNFSHLMSQSLVINYKNNNNLQQSRMEVIKSMERIVALFD